MTTEAANPPMTTCPDWCDRPDPHPGYAGWRPHTRHVVSIDDTGELGRWDFSIDQGETEDEGWTERLIMIDDHSGMEEKRISAAQARLLAAALVEAADELESLNAQTGRRQQPGR